MPKTKELEHLALYDHAVQRMEALQRFGFAFPIPRDARRQFAAFIRGFEAAAEGDHPIASDETYMQNIAITWLMAFAQARMTCGVESDVCPKAKSH